jgi:hypothetical protein
MIEIKNIIEQAWTNREMLGNTDVKVAVEGL